jgi:hypothetical protein
MPAHNMPRVASLDQLRFTQHPSMDASSPGGLLLQHSALRQQLTQHHQHTRMVPLPTCRTNFRE